MDELIHTIEVQAEIIAALRRTRAQMAQEIERLTAELADAVKARDEANGGVMVS